MAAIYINRYTAQGGEDDTVIDFLKGLGDKLKARGCLEFRIFHCEDLREYVVTLEAWPEKKTRQDCLDDMHEDDTFKGIYSTMNGAPVGKWYEAL